MDRRSFLALSSLSILGVPSLSFGDTKRGWVKMHESMLYDVLRKNTSEKGMALAQLMNKYFKEIEKHDNMVSYVYSSIKNRELMIKHAPDWLAYDILRKDSNKVHESYYKCLAVAKKTGDGFAFNNRRYYMWTAHLVADDNCKDMIIFSSKELDIFADFS